MSEFGINIASTIAENQVEPILSTFGYLTNFNRNVEDLKNQVDKLESAKETVNQLIEVAKRNAEVIQPEVQKWVKNTDEIIEEVKKLEDEIILKKGCCCNGCFPNIVFKFRISIVLKKKVGAVIKLQKGSKFEKVSYPPLPPGIESLSSEDFMAFESRKLTMNQIMDALKDDEVAIVGVHGMGGVGKTVMVREVGKRLKELKLFDEVVLGVVSNTPNVREIQGQIADMLGLKFNENSEFGRARRLCTRMKNRKILIILDDIWARLDLEVVGIPLDQKGCKILLTTRHEHVCNSFDGPTKKIQLNALEEEESWALFSRVAGEEVNSPTFNSVAREVVRECRGLPSMLTTIGRRLKWKSLEQWEGAAKQLKKSNPMNKGKGDQEDFINQYDD